MIYITARDVESEKKTDFIDSITVIVILSLVVSIGYTVKSIVHNSTAVSTGSKMVMLTEQVQSFQSSYHCIPGDCASRPVGFIEDFKSGNGDGVINGSFVHTNNNEKTSWEGMNAFVHLLGVDMIEQNSLWRSGINPTAVYNEDAVYKYAPHTGIENGYLLFQSINSSNVLAIIGNDKSNLTISPNDVRHLQKIDEKFDDGSLLSGSIRSYVKDPKSGAITTDVSLRTMNNEAKNGCSIGIYYIL